MSDRSALGSYQKVELSPSAKLAIKSAREIDTAMDLELDMRRMDIDPPKADQNPDVARYISLAVNASWVVNWFLFGAKGFTYCISLSKAVLAALVDSAVDLVSQGVLALAETYMAKFSPDYPVGRSRLEALSVIACAFIMSTASLEGILRYCK